MTDVFVELLTSEDEHVEDGLMRFKVVDLGGGPIAGDVYSFVIDVVSQAGISVSERVVLHSEVGPHLLLSSGQLD